MGLRFYPVTRLCHALLRNCTDGFVNSACNGCSSLVTTWQPKRRSRLMRIGARKFMAQLPFCLLTTHNAYNRSRSASASDDNWLCPTRMR